MAHQAIATGPCDDLTLTFPVYVLRQEMELYCMEDADNGYCPMVFTDRAAAEAFAPLVMSNAAPLDAYCFLETLKSFPPDMTWIAVNATTHPNGSLDRVYMMPIEKALEQ